MGILAKFQNKPVGSIHWELLEVTGMPGMARRCKVPGGWLLSMSIEKREINGCTFIPDPNHDWDGNSLP